MGTRTSYTPGTFSWVDLTTSDQEGAKGFYADLFGWSFEDRPAGEGVVYSMASVEGEDVAAIAPLPPGDPGPPRWNNYVTVADAEAAAARAAELGGTVLTEPFDVFDAGRMAVVADPVGGVFCVWQAGTNIGAGRVNEPGCMTWNEFGTPDPQIVVPFYTELFGWGTEAMPAEGGPSYIVISVDGRANGGLREQSPPEKEAGAPSFWMPYFAVEDADAIVAKAAERDAQTMLEPMDMPNGGRIAALADPQGAVFAIWAGSLDD
jgi:hypothetical protein